MPDVVDVVTTRVEIKKKHWNNSTNQMRKTLDVCFTRRHNQEYFVFFQIDNGRTHKEVNRKRERLYNPQIIIIIKDQMLLISNTRVAAAQHARVTKKKKNLMEGGGYLFFFFLSLWPVVLEMTIKTKKICEKMNRENRERACVLFIGHPPTFFVFL